MLLNRTGPELLHSSEVMLLFSQLVAILPRSLPSSVHLCPQTCCCCSSFRLCVKDIYIYIYIKKQLLKCSNAPPMVPVRIALLPLISGRFDKQSLELCVISEVVSQL